jgi:hypothetical protein
LIKSLLLDSLSPGDAIGFKEKSESDSLEYSGIILESSSVPGVGEVFYKVLCDDNIIRYFMDYEIINIRYILKIDSYDKVKKNNQKFNS